VFGGMNSVAPRSHDSEQKGHRVVVMSGSSFNRVRGGALTLTNLFAGWPRDRLGMIHCDAIPPTNEICDTYYELSGKEITRLGPFLGMRSLSTQSSTASASRASLSTRVGRFGKRAVFGNMLPDRGRLSNALIAWLENFQPTVLYTTLGSNALMDLALAIADRFGTRLVVHFMDDWQSVAYRGGMLSFVPRGKMEREVREVVSRADLRLGISPAMCREYEARYGKAFEPYMNAVDTSRYARAQLASKQPTDRKEVLYIGSILPDVQLQSLIDSCHATALLRDRGVTLAILTSPAFLERYRSALAVAPNITVGEAPPDGDEFIRRLQSASLLLLPVNFDAASVDFIRYSLPTKVPAYLASGTPILAYGPRKVAQIEYARDQRWAHVVNERSVTGLSDAMEHLIKNDRLRADLSEQAMIVARAHHDIAEVRSRFQSALASVN
jgi:glycosyltransferase involved in cell wall biosynthesis